MADENGLNADTGFSAMRGFTAGGGGFGGGGGDPNAFAHQIALQNNAGKIASNQARQGFGYNTALQGSNLDLQRYLGDQSSSTQRYGIDQTAATQRQGNELQYQASILGPNLKQQRFNTVLPMFQDAFKGFNSQSGGGSPQGTAPTITTGGVYDENQIQQKVNAARAQNDKTMGTQINSMQGDLAGRGYGAGSPLAMALQQNFMGQNMAANTSNERETRLGAATANATQNLNSQQAAEAQYANRQNEDIERHKTKNTALTGWLGSLGSIV